MLIFKKILLISLFYLELTKEQVSEICAQVQCFFTDESSIKKALAAFETKIQATWLALAKKNNLDADAFPLHAEFKNIPGLGLEWPLPTSAAQCHEKYHGLLNTTLHEFEQSVGINLPFYADDIHSPIPTFIGFVNNSLADALIERHRIWREETTFAGQLFHGKDTHRLHLAALYEASNLEILKLDTFKISFTDFLKLLALTRLRKNKSLWNTLVDYQGNIHSNSHIGQDTCSNPFYFHNYLLNSTQFLFLRACVRKQFWQGLAKLHTYQQQVGYYLEPGVQSDPCTARTIPTSDAWSLEDTLQNQVRLFETRNVTIDPVDAVISFINKGKLNAIPELTIHYEDLLKVKHKTTFRDTTYGILHRTHHYGLSIFKLKQPQPVQKLLPYSVNKEDIIFDLDKIKISLCAMKWLKQQGYTNQQINMLSRQELKKILFTHKLQEIMSLNSNKEDDIIAFVTDKDTRKQFTTSEQVIALAEKSAIAATILAKDDYIRSLFVDKTTVIEFVQKYPSTKQYFSSDIELATRSLSPSN